MPSKFALRLQHHYQLSQTHPISHFLRASRKYVVWWCTSWWTRYFFSFQGNKYDHLKQHVGTEKSFDDYGVSSTIWKEINEIVSNFLRNINWYSRPVQIELLSMNLVFSMASNTLLKVVLLFYMVLFAGYPFHNDWADFWIWNQFFVIFYHFWSSPCYSNQMVFWGISIFSKKSKFSWLCFTVLKKFGHAII